MIFDKTTILVLGDSFAVPRSPDSKNGPTWTSLLDMDPRYRVTNLAEGGSSMWFSFRNFMRHHANYDRIIFAVTESHRIYHLISHEPGLQHHNHRAMMWLEKHRKLCKEIDPNHPHIERIDAIKLYFKHIMDLEERDVVQRLMIKEIREVRPDTILIPSFDTSISDHEGDCLIHISERELNHLGLSIGNAYRTHEELRACHMIKENNEILYEHAVRWINGDNMSLHVEDFKVMPADQLNRYFPPIANNG